MCSLTNYCRKERHSNSKESSVLNCCIKNCILMFYSNIFLLSFFHFCKSFDKLCTYNIDVTAIMFASKVNNYTIFFNLMIFYYQSSFYRIYNYFLLYQAMVGVLQYSRCIHEYVFNCYFSKLFYIHLYRLYIVYRYMQSFHHVGAQQMYSCKFILILEKKYWSKKNGDLSSSISFLFLLGYFSVDRFLYYMYLRPIHFSVNNNQ